MSKPISIYSSIFNAITHAFDYADALDNFTRFAGEEGEVVIAVNDSQDDTLDAIKQWQSDNKDRKLVIIESHVSYEDPLFDGSIKEAAMQNCKNLWQIGLDADERICVEYKDRWIYYFDVLENSSYKGHLVPSLEPWGHKDYIRFDKEKNIYFKWSQNLKGCHRGAVNFSKLPNGKLDLTKGDGCELISDDGELIKCPALIPQELFKNPTLENYLGFLKNEGIWVWHLGFLDLSRRVKLNNNFWRKTWILESGKEKEGLELSESQLVHRTYPHYLPYYK